MSEIIRILLRSEKQRERERYSQRKRGRERQEGKSSTFTMDIIKGEKSVIINKQLWKQN